MKCEISLSKIVLRQVPGGGGGLDCTGQMIKKMEKEKHILKGNYLIKVILKMMRNMVSGHTGLKMEGLIKKRNISMAFKQMANITTILITK